MSSSDLPEDNFDDVFTEIEDSYSTEKESSREILQSITDKKIELLYEIGGTVSRGYIFV